VNEEGVVTKSMGPAGAAKATRRAAIIEMWRTLSSVSGNL